MYYETINADLMNSILEMQDEALEALFDAYYKGKITVRELYEERSRIKKICHIALNGVVQNIKPEE